MYKQKEKIKAHHGTYPVYKESIQQNNFYESNADIWVGPGVYFFVNGISAISSIECAAQWAIDQEISRPHTPPNTECIVIEATIPINENKYLDLTKDEGLKLFNEFRDEIIKKIGNPTSKYNDTDVLKVMREALNIELVKANVYIRLGIQREQKMPSRFPNVTIFVVNNPVTNIQKPSIVEVDRRKITL